MDEICESCQGTGEWSLSRDCEDGITMTCPECGGWGYTNE
jgi:excinuclease UvrABC ATPase subunit